MKLQFEATNVDILPNNIGFARVVEHLTVCKWHIVVVANGGANSGTISSTPLVVVLVVVPSHRRRRRRPDKSSAYPGGGQAVSGEMGDRCYFSGIAGCSTEVFGCRNFPELLMCHI